MGNGDGPTTPDTAQVRSQQLVTDTQGLEAGRTTCTSHRPYRGCTKEQIDNQGAWEVGFVILRG